MTLYTPKDFSALLGTEGFSDTLLSNHFALYEGYVKNTNALLELLPTKTLGTPERAELQRRFGWEWNGMRLHELYFENLSPETQVLGDGSLKEKLVATFGSLEAWQEDFLGLAAMRGIGWALLVEDTESKMLFNTWVTEHDGGHLAGTRPLLVLDVFEHAYLSDYGIKRAEYLAAFARHIHWNAVEKRFGQ
jgi:Fe-Mn family superoxide dismutase